VRRATIGLLLAALVGGGCAGHPPASKPRASEAGDEDAEREQAARGLPAADRVAYFQVATSIGAMRGRASLVATGRSGARQADAVVKATIPRLRNLRPRNARLVRLRDRALGLARRSADSPLRGASARRDADRQLAEVDRLSRSLDSLVRSDPRFSALVPD